MHFQLTPHNIAGKFSIKALEHTNKAVYLKSNVSSNLSTKSANRTSSKMILHADLMRVCVVT